MESTKNHRQTKYIVRTIYELAKKKYLTWTFNTTIFDLSSSNKVFTKRKQNATQKKNASYHWFVLKGSWFFLKVKVWKKGKKKKSQQYVCEINFENFLLHDVCNNVFEKFRTLDEYKYVNGNWNKIQNPLCVCNERKYFFGFIASGTIK